MAKRIAKRGFIEVSSGNVFADLAGLVALSLRPRRVDAATRVSLALLSRLFDSGVPEPPSEFVPSATPLTRHRARRAPRGAR